MAAEAVVAYTAKKQRRVGMYIVGGGMGSEVLEWMDEED